MVRILPPFAALLVACTPSPEETAMRSPGPADSKGEAKAAAGPVPVTENPLPAARGDSPAEAEGRRTLSTAFVRVGPDGHLTVELRNGRVLLLRDVVMRPRDFCGVQLLGGKAGARFCGGYAEVAAARPGGVPAPEGLPGTEKPVGSL